MQLQLKIQLQGISKPPVWRKIRVPGNFTLHRLHSVIQAAFGWDDYHFYQFSDKGYGSRERYGIPNEDDYLDQDLKDSNKINCADIFAHVGQTYTYIYDFGDDWIHKITVEKITDTLAIRAELIAGKGACPPEDCGGPHGYANMLNILSDPKHEEYDDMCSWLGAEDGDEATDIWDVNYFNLEVTSIKVSGE